MALLAGASAAELPVPLGQALYGYPTVERPATGVHDPLLASAIVFENDCNRGAIISLDILFLDPPTSRKLRTRVAEAIGVDESLVFIGCTHTHSGPVTTTLLAWKADPAVPPPQPGFLEAVTDRAVAAAKDASENMQDAELAWGRADATGVGGNRHSPRGVTDPGCGILAIRDRKRHELLSVVVIYGMHPTVLHEDSTLASADFPHYTRLHIREHFGDNATVVYLTAPCGNQSPRYFIQEHTFHEAERLGRKLGAAVCESIDSMNRETWRSTPGIRGIVSQVDLERKQLPSLPLAKKKLRVSRDRYQSLIKREASKPEVRTAECAVFGAEGLVELARAQDRGDIDTLLSEYKPFEIQVLDIGGTYLAGLPGEVFTEYGLELKRRIEGRVYVAAFVNGETQGYVVTPEAQENGEYESTNSLFRPESGGIMIDAATSLIENLEVTAEG